MMVEEPKTIKEVNSNMIELKKAHIALKGKLNKFHKDYHEKGISTPLTEIKSIETEVEQYSEMIDIAVLQKENINTDKALINLREQVERLKKENNSLKQQIYKLKNV